MNESINVFLDSETPAKQETRENNEVSQNYNGYESSDINPLNFNLKLILGRNTKEAKYINFKDKYSNYKFSDATSTDLNLKTEAMLGEPKEHQTELQLISGLSMLLTTKNNSQLKSEFSDSKFIMINPSILPPVLRFYQHESSYDEKANEQNYPNTTHDALQDFRTCSFSFVLNTQQISTQLKNVQTGYQNKFYQEGKFSQEINSSNSELLNSNKVEKGNMIIKGNRDLKNLENTNIPLSLIDYAPFLCGTMVCDKCGIEVNLTLTNSFLEVTF